MSSKLHYNDLYRLRSKIRHNFLIYNDPIRESEIQPVKITRMSIDKTLKNIGKVFKYIPNLNSVDCIDECVICLNTLCNNELVRQLDCKHIYHKDCIDNWLYPRYHRDEILSCPLCRQYK